MSASEINEAIKGLLTEVAEREQLPVVMDYSLLFQPENETTALHLLDVRTKRLKSEKVGFAFPKWKGSCHFGRHFYLAGGVLDKAVLSQFRRLTEEADEKLLAPMPKAKHCFQLAACKAKRWLLTVGGFGEDLLLAGHQPVEHLARLPLPYSL